MEIFAKYLSIPFHLSEDEFIKKLSIRLDNGAGGDIDRMYEADFFFPHEKEKKTILHHCIQRGHKRVVKYLLSRGANVAKEMTMMSGPFRYHNALDLAALYHFVKLKRKSYDLRDSIFDMVKQHSLKAYSSYGLTAFHMDCVSDLKYWSQEAVQRLSDADVNLAVSQESPLWPGMTPILIAAKFKNLDLVVRLLDLGADPIVCDAKGNTPLHYLDEFYGALDERLFAQDGADTFGSMTGESHFHVACRHCPHTLNMVKTYLDRGVSPDLPITNCREGRKPDDDYLRVYDTWTVGLHIAAGLADAKASLELVKLLLDYGADCNVENVRGFSPLLDFDDRFTTPECKQELMECICLLIEGGANQDREDSFDENMIDYLETESSVATRRVYLERIGRLLHVDKKLVGFDWDNIYRALADYLAPNEWNEEEFLENCTEELLSMRSLRGILDDTIKVDGEYKEKFEWIVDCIDATEGLYPIYGDLLRFKIRRNLIEYERKKTKVKRAAPAVQSMFEKQGNLPNLCAELILWNLSYAELCLFGLFVDEASLASHP